MHETRALLFVNGIINDLAAAKQVLQPDDLWVAVDGGLHHLQRMGLQPHWLIGDLDSVDPEEVLQLEAAGVRILRFPVEKDETDLELALQTAVTGGFRSIRILGSLGGRLDQTLGNLFLLAHPMLAGCDVRLLDPDGNQEIFIIQQSCVIEGQPGNLISLIPLNGPAGGIRTKGLYYPLQGETLYPDRTRGISNKMTDDRAEVSVAEGLLLCIHAGSSR